jgi:hypothetical protein
VDIKKKEIRKKEIKMIKLGDRVTDKITGFKGIAVARCEYLNGCVRYEIQPEELNDGKISETFWIDQTQLEEYKKPNINETGGPANIPTPFSKPTKFSNSKLG